MATDYDPKPIPTDNIGLSDEIMALIELLAENAHDVWSLERLRGGWSHGSSRDDIQRLHPGLVPYADLPEHEKDIDRAMVAGSIRAMLALGFSISRRVTVEPTKH
jgi:hypothetical protein